MKTKSMPKARKSKNISRVVFDVKTFTAELHDETEPDKPQLLIFEDQDDVDSFVAAFGGGGSDEAEAKTKKKKDKKESPEADSGDSVEGKKKKKKDKKEKKKKKDKKEKK